MLWLIYLSCRFAHRRFDEKFNLESTQKPTRSWNVTCKIMKSSWDWIKLFTHLLVWILQLTTIKDIEMNGCTKYMPTAKFRGRLIWAIEIVAAVADSEQLRMASWMLSVAEVSSASSAGKFVETVNPLTPCSPAAIWESCGPWNDLSHWTLKSHCMMKSKAGSRWRERTGSD